MHVAGYEEIKHYEELTFPNINQMEEGVNLEENRISKILALLNLEAEEKDSMEKIVKKYHNVFQLEEDPLTYTTVLTHEIPLKPGVASINRRQYRLPEAHKDEINKQVVERIRQDIIVPSKSPWNLPIVLVPKNQEIRGKRSGDW